MDNNIVSGDFAFVKYSNSNIENKGNNANIVQNNIFSQTADINNSAKIITEGEQEKSEEFDIQPSAKNEVDIEQCAVELMNLTRNKYAKIGEIEDFLAEIPFDDIVSSIKEYNNINSKSFIQTLDSKFKDFDRNLIMSFMAETLCIAAEGNNAEAIEVICKELFNSTAGKLGTADEFVMHMADNLSNNPDILREVINEYPVINKGHKLYNDIKNDFSGENKKTLLSILNKK